MKRQISFAILGILILLAGAVFVVAQISPITPSLNLNGQNQFTINNYSTINNIQYATPNSASSIQSAISRCSSNGCLVVVPQGTYNIGNSTIFLNKTGLKIQGQGYNTLIQGGALTTHVLSIGAAQVEISNIRIEGNGSANNAGVGAWATDADTPFAHGIHFGAEASNVNIHDVWINDTIRSSIGQGNFVSGLTVSNAYLSNSLGDHLLYISEGTNVNVNNIHGSGYYAKRCAFKVGSGSVPATSNFTNLNNLIYSGWVANPNNYTSSEDSVLCIVNDGSKATSISNLMIKLPLTSGDTIGILATEDVNLNNINIEGNFTNKQALYISNADANINNLHISALGTGRGIRINNNEAENHTVIVNNFQIRNYDEGAYGKFNYGVLDDLSSENGTLILSNGYIEATNGVRLTTAAGGVIKYYESNLDLARTTTARNFNENMTYGESPSQWTNLFDYPAACPTGSYLTQLNDSVTCTAITSIPNNVALENNNLTGFFWLFGGHIQLERTLWLNASAIGSDPVIDIAGGAADTREIDFNDGRAEVKYLSNYGLQLLSGTGRSMKFTVSGADRLVINSTGAINITGLTGTGNDFVCVDANGILFRSDTACA